MSRFFDPKYAGLKPYVPGEQPTGQPYIKLNTNESPYPPDESVIRAAAEESARARLYSDPECRALRETLAGRLGVDPDEVLMTNGSDEILNFAFMAFCGKDCPAVFPDITYGFYPVFAQIDQVPWREIPLTAELRIDPEDYRNAWGTIFLANPNAPTGIALSRETIEGILKSNPDHVVVVDEAYVDFGAESCVPLIREYDNLLVTQTFSKSRSLAGARLGFGAGQAALIRDLNTVKYSTNPYNVNRITAAMGKASLEADEVNREHCRQIRENREWTAKALKAIGFEMTESVTNFLFARHPGIGGEELYRKLKARGILIRHFNGERIRDYNRITIGTREQMETLVREIREILAEEESA